MILMLFVLCTCGTAFADNNFGGINLTNTQNGTVSGGLYSDNYYSNGTSQQLNSSKVANKTFKDLPANATVAWARLSVVVYCGHQQDDRSGYANITFNGQQLGYEYLKSNYVFASAGGSPVWLNDHVNRITSDYVMYYDVTSMVGSQNTALVETTPETSNFDGLIKLINLVVAYNDGDSDKIMYWVNYGHDTCTGNNSYLGKTFFNGTILGDIVDGELGVVHLASTDGIYTFNGNPISSGSPQGSYSGLNNWNITGISNNGPVNNLTYDNVGSYYKIILAMLSVKYEPPVINLADLKVQNMEIPPSIINLTSSIKASIINMGNNNSSNFKAKLFDNNVEIGSQIISSLSAGDSMDLTFNWTPSTLGIHNLKLVLDTDNTVNESNEFNNEFKSSVIVEKQRPDLTVTGLDIPGEIFVLKPYNITATLKNTGLNISSSFAVKIMDNNKEISSRIISSLNSGQSQTIVLSWIPESSGSHNIKILIDPLNAINESNENNNELSQSFLVKEGNKTTIFLISDTSGTNILNSAAKEILEQYSGKFIIQVRNNQQVVNMSDNEFISYLNSDIFIGEWLSTDVSSKLLSILKAHPEISNKSIFLVLEPSISTLPESVSLMNYSTINGVKLLSNFTTAQLNAYYANTTRGTDYSSVLNYTLSSGFPALYNKATLYKDLNDKDSLKNQILWALNLMNLPLNYTEPTFSADKQDYGIYRYKWYVKLDSSTGKYVMDIESYMHDYFVSGRPTVGLIESTMYVNSQQLEPYYKIIESLEARGMNVIPVMAYGGSTEQLKVMLEAFTNATNITSFLNNPSSYQIKVDSIIEMPAYGLGGDSFTSTSAFFEALNVTIIRAIHSDSVSNEEWELSSTGLPSTSGDKWWHIAISEAQGIILATFVGGQSTIIDNATGAALVGYVPQLENIGNMADKIKGWVDLKYTNNADKLLALIYYNYPPGKDNIGSSYMNTLESLYNLLNILKSQGYKVDNLPTNESALRSLMIQLGINVANWAPGVLQNMTNNPNIILYPVASYQQWFSKLDNMTQLQVIEGPVAYIGELCKKAVNLDYTDGMAEKIESWYSEMVALLPSNRTAVAKPVLDNIVASLKNYVSTKNVTYYNQFLTYKAQFFAINVSGMNGWGQIPGNVMVVTKNGTQYFVIPGLKFGNIFIGPEPQRGWEADSDKLYHNSVVAPPHQYLAYFAYLQEQGTDAMIYMGRHATHEWLPGKEVILSPDDLPSIVTGSVPQIYYYISDGLAEGIQAKRRGNAVIISHLTPPMTFTALYGDLGNLSVLVDDYDGANATQKPLILAQIVKILNNNTYYLGNTTVLSGDALVEAVNDYLVSIQSTLYPYGLHAIGGNWTDDEVALLVTSMLSVDFEVNNGSQSTSLHDEIAKILKGKTYDQLGVIDKQTVQNKCVAIIKALIYWDVDTVANILTISPSNNFKEVLSVGKEYIGLINQSIQNEVNSLLTALNGGYVAPGAGGDPISYPSILPTGTNFFDDQGSEIPTKEAYAYAKTLALLALADINDDTEKIAVGIWCVETARDDGALVAMVLYLLGMEPQWSDSPNAGVDGQKLKEMPKYVELSDLVRPAGWEKKRIDVIVVTSGLFRDLYSRQAGLLDNAFRVALARSYYTIINNATLTSRYGTTIKTSLDKIMSGIGYYGAESETLAQNYVAQHWLEDTIYYMSLNMTPEIAGEMAISKIFAPPEGDYGAGIAKAASLSWTWNNTTQLADYYLARMGHMYTHNNWGLNNPAVFARALSGIDTMFASRNTNLYGVLDNDDFFDYWGGLSMALEKVNGKLPNFYVINYADKNNANTMSIDEYINRELVTRDLNPEYIKGMMKEGYDGARYFSKFMKNLKGWATTRPSSVLNDYWNQVVDTYLKDKNNIGITEFLRSDDNTYALISMTGTLLEMAYKGNWKTDSATLKMVANEWAQAAIKNGVACCDCSCGNLAMMEWASQFINPNILAQFKSTIYAATGAASFAPSSSPSTNPNSGGSTSQGESTSQGGQTSKDQSSSPSESSGSAGSENSQQDEETQSTPGESSQKSYEVSQASSSAATKSGMPVYAIIGVILLIVLFAGGYYFGPKKE